MDYDELPDWEAQNYDSLAESFIEKHSEEWEEHVIESFESMLQDKSEDDYDRWKDSQLDKEI